ncbi:hypothetical protein [Streptomyces sp. NPDC091215]|uniref:hypothetical protein n=1 Tax=Streptomyces sp. NPDC091215 TaxID=3155192 RepID=UPI00341DD205
MGPAVDDRHLRHVVSRLAALPNVWWSLADEYDLVKSEPAEQWHHCADVIRAYARRTAGATSPCRNRSAASGR